MTSAISIATGTTTRSEEMTPHQIAFVVKTTQTVARVVFELLETIIRSHEMIWHEFVATYIDPKQQSLSEMDERTRKFFMKMMEAINPAIDAIPTLKDSVQKFGIAAQDPQIGKKLVEGFALSHVKTLIAELDAINPSIIDDVI